MTAGDHDEAATVDGLVQLSFLVLGELGRVAAGYELSLSQIRLLGILRDRRPPMLELGRRLELGKSSVTGLVDRAEARGLVRRAPDDADGRGVRVELTESGCGVAAAFTAAMTTRVEHLLAGLEPADRAQLTRLAWQLLERAGAS